MSKQKENDEFGQRMKLIESVSDKQLRGYGEIVVRIDGRAFSTFTRDCKKPFDPFIADCMIETTKYLVNKTKSFIGYTQSDEISLVLGNELPFSGRIQKIASVFAGMATSKFMLELRNHPMSCELQARLPHFDARVFEVPKMEAANAILWRAMDAKKNAIQSVAQSLFSHKQLHGKDQKAMLKMIDEAGVNYEFEYLRKYRLGTFIRKANVECALTDEELSRIPEKHRPPGGKVIRSVYYEAEMPPFNKVKNRIEVIFEGADPIVEA